MREGLLVSLCLLVLTLAVFLQVQHHEFVNLDDPVYIVRNPVLREGLSTQSVVRAFTQPLEAHWIPLTALSLQVDYALYGLEPAGYLLTNVGLHAAASVLLFWALASLTGARGRSAFVAAVFAVHPLHVESVAWATERKDVLSGLFFMLTLVAYAHSRKQPRSAWRELAVLICFTASVLAKPTAVTLPFVLLLLDYWPLGRLGSGSGAPLDLARLWRAVVEKFPLFAMSAAVCALTYATQRGGGGMIFAETLRFGARFANALIAYAVYAEKTLWPSGLAVFYPFPEAVSPLAVAVAGLLLIALSAAAFALARRAPYLVCGWLWFLGTLVPAIGIVQVGMQARADRFMYLPLIGLILALAWGVADLASRIRLPTVLLRAGAGAALTLLALLSFRQVAFWSDTRALFERALQVTEANYFAHYRLAEEYRASDELDPAALHLRETIRLRPEWARPRFLLANVREHQGNLPEALELYAQGLALSPDDEEALLFYGLSLLRAGRVADARNHLEEAARRKPGSGDLWRALELARQREEAPAR